VATEGERTASTRRLAVRVTLIAVTVGAVAAAAAAFSGSGPCAETSLDPAFPARVADPVCYALVRTMAERVGLLTAVFTAILILTVIGVSRVGGHQAGPAGPDPSS